MMTNPTPRRGEVWQVRLDPVVGSEIGKTRPAVVLTRNNFGRLAVQIVVPFTDWKPRYAGVQWFVDVAATATNGLTKRSGADVLHVKSISVERFVRRLGDLPADEVDEIASAVAFAVVAP